MKITQLLYGGLGGHGSVAFSLLKADETNEWHPEMGFFGIEPLLPTYAENCSLNSIPFKYFPGSSGRSFKALIQIDRWLEERRSDVVILHSPTLIMACLWNRWIRHVPLIVVEHQANALKRRSELLASLLAMLLADKIVILTSAYAEELRNKLGNFYFDKKVVVIPNGIDTKLYSPFPKLLHSKRIIRMGMASRFMDSKRQNILVMMMLELKKLQPEFKWSLSLAGSGETYGSIQRLVNANGLEDDVELPGQLDERQLLKWYQSMDLYLHASDGETLSTAILQAMSMALPVIASDVAGIRNLLSVKPACGVLVDKSEPLNFAVEVLNLVNDWSAATNLGRNGRQLAITIYDNRRMFDAYNKVIRSTL